MKLDTFGRHIEISYDDLVLRKQLENSIARLQAAVFAYNEMDEIVTNFIRMNRIQAAKVIAETLPALFSKVCDRLTELDEQKELITSPTPEQREKGIYYFQY